MLLPVAALAITDAESILTHHLQALAGLTPDELRLADGLWTRRAIAKNEFFNFRNAVCRHVVFVVRGLFRVYYVDPATSKEHNVFFVAENTFLTSLKSLLTHEGCPYYVAAVEDAELWIIGVEPLQRLYAAAHGWERFGRRLAEQYLILHQAKAESLLFQSAEERYLGLLAQVPGITNRVSLGHIASYLGIQGPSLSRIRAKLGAAKQPSALQQSRNV